MFVCRTRGENLLSLSKLTEFLNEVLQRLLLFFFTFVILLWHISLVVFLFHDIMCKKLLQIDATLSGLNLAVAMWHYREVCNGNNGISHCPFCKVFCHTRWYCESNLSGTSELADDAFNAGLLLCYFFNDSIMLYIMPNTVLCIISCVLWL